MEKVFDNVISSAGRPVARASIAVTLYPSGERATIYSDDGITTRPNPIIADDLGYFEFYAASGRYTLTITGDGIEPIVRTDVPIGEAGSGADVLDALAKADGAKSVGYGSRTVDARLGDTVSAADYPTLQAALNTGRIVQLVDGATYQVTSQLRVPSRGGLIGKGVLTFNSENFTATNKGVGSDCIVILAQNADNITLRDFKMLGTCGQNSYLFAVALRDVRDADVRKLDISGLNAGACVLIDSSFDVTMQNLNLHDCTLDRNIPGGQLTGVLTDEFRINGVGSERLHFPDANIRRLLWTPAFLAAYGPQSDGFNIQVGTRKYSISNAIIDEVGEGIDTFGEDGTITAPNIDRALGYALKFIHGASRNTVNGGRINRSGLGGLVIAGSNTAAQNTDANTIKDLVISNAGYDPGAYWSQTKYAVAINNDGVYKATNTRVRGVRVINSGSVNCAFLAATSGVGNVYDGNETDGSAPVEYQGSGVTVFKPKQFGGVLTSGRVATFDQFGALTLRYDDNSLTVPAANRNYAITGAGQGVSYAAYFGAGSAFGAQAYACEVTATDTWAAAGSRSSKITWKAAKAGVLVSIGEMDPDKGLSLLTAGQGIRVKEGTGGRQGTTTLTAGVDGVSNTTITANSRIQVTSMSDGVTGALRAIPNPGVGFTIKSSNAGDAGVVAYFITEAA